MAHQILKNHILCDELGYIMKLQKKFLDLQT